MISNKGICFPPAKFDLKNLKWGATKIPQNNDSSTGVYFDLDFIF